MNMDSMIDTIMPAGAEVCFPETGSLAGKYTKAIADSTGVTFSQFTVADCTGAAAETTKITPAKCTSLPAAYNKDGKVQYAYLGGSPGACEAGVFKGNCPPTGIELTLGGASPPADGVLTFTCTGGRHSANGERGSIVTFAVFSDSDRAVRKYSDGPAYSDMAYTINTRVRVRNVTLSDTSAVHTTPQSLQLDITPVNNVMSGDRFYFIASQPLWFETSSNATTCTAVEMSATRNTPTGRHIAITTAWTYDVFHNAPNPWSSFVPTSAPTSAPTTAPTSAPTTAAPTGQPTSAPTIVGIEITGGAVQTIAKDTVISGTVSSAVHYPCWATFEEGVTVDALEVGDCQSAGTQTTFGNQAHTECAAAGSAWSLVWNDDTRVKVSMIECMGAGQGILPAVTMTLSLVGIVVTNGANQTIAQDTVISGTVTSALHFPCFRTNGGGGASAAPVVRGPNSADACGTAGSAVEFGKINDVVCAPAGTDGTWSLTWDNLLSYSISIIECDGTKSVGLAVELSLTQESIVVDGGPTQRLVRDDYIAGRVRESNSWVCWTATAVFTSMYGSMCKCINAGCTGSYVAPVTGFGFGDRPGGVACAVASSSNTWNVQWDDNNKRAISIIECTGSGTSAGDAILISIIDTGVRIDNWDVESPIIIEKDATLSGTVSDANNYICWKAGTSTITTAECLAVGSLSGIGSAASAVRCSASSLAWSLTWDDVSVTTVSIIECSSNGVGVGTEIGLTITRVTDAPTQAPAPASAAPTQFPLTSMTPTVAPTAPPPRVSALSIVVGESYTPVLASSATNHGNYISFNCSGGFAPNGDEGTAVTFSAYSTSDAEHATAIPGFTYDSPRWMQKTYPTAAQCSNFVAANAQLEYTTTCISALASNGAIRASGLSPGQQESFCATSGCVAALESLLANAMADTSTVAYERCTEIGGYHALARVVCTEVDGTRCPFTSLFNSGTENALPFYGVFDWGGAKLDDATYVSLVNQTCTPCNEARATAMHAALINMAPDEASLEDAKLKARLNSIACMKGTVQDPGVASLRVTRCALSFRNLLSSSLQFVLTPGSNPYCSDRGAGGTQNCPRMMLDAYLAIYRQYEGSNHNAKIMKADAAFIDAGNKVSCMQNPATGAYCMSMITPSGMHGNTVPNAFDAADCNPMGTYGNLSQATYRALILGEEHVLAPTSDQLSEKCVAALIAEESHYGCCIDFFSTADALSIEMNETRRVSKGRFIRDTFIAAGFSCSVDQPGCSMALKPACTTSTVTAQVTINFVGLSMSWLIAHDAIVRQTIATAIGNAQYIADITYKPTTSGLSRRRLDEVELESERWSESDLVWRVLPPSAATHRRRLESTSTTATVTVGTQSSGVTAIAVAALVSGMQDISQTALTAAATADGLTGGSVTQATSSAFTNPTLAPTPAPAPAPPSVVWISAKREASPSTDITFTLQTSGRGSKLLRGSKIMIDSSRGIWDVTGGAVTCSIVHHRPVYSGIARQVGIDRTVVAVSDTTVSYANSNLMVAPATTGIFINGGATQSLLYKEPNYQEVTGTLTSAQNYPCWRVRAAADLLNQNPLLRTECGVVSGQDPAQKSFIGDRFAGVVCGKVGSPWSIQWDFEEDVRLSMIECSAPGIGFGDAASLVITRSARRVDVIGGAEQTLTKGAQIVANVGSFGYVCFTSGTLAAPAAQMTHAKCKAAAAASAAGTGSVALGISDAVSCGDTSTPHFIWNDVSRQSFSFMECTGSGTGIGVAVRLTITEASIKVIPSSTLYLSQDDNVVVQVSTIRNYACWTTSGTTATPMTHALCQAASGTTNNQIGAATTVVCNEGDDQSTTSNLVWNDRSSTSISIIECAGDGKGVGAALELTLIQQQTGHMDRVVITIDSEMTGTGMNQLLIITCTGRASTTEAEDAVGTAVSFSVSSSGDPTPAEARTGYTTAAADLSDPSYALIEMFPSRSCNISDSGNNNLFKLVELDVCHSSVNSNGKASAYEFVQTAPDTVGAKLYSGDVCTDVDGDTGGLYSFSYIAGPTCSDQYTVPFVDTFNNQTATSPYAISNHSDVFFDVYSDGACTSHAEYGAQSTDASDYALRGGTAACVPDYALSASFSVELDSNNGSLLITSHPTSMACEGRKITSEIRQGICTPAPSDFCLTATARASIACYVFLGGSVACDQGLFKGNCPSPKCNPYAEDWASAGVLFLPNASKNLLDPSAVVESSSPKFGDQLSFECLDNAAALSGPSTPTCLADGSWYPAISTANPVVCECAAGSAMLAAGSCKLCDANTFSNAAGATECEACNADEGETSAEGAVGCTRGELECPDGTYKDMTKSSCLSCPKSGAVCEDNEIRLIGSWWFDTELLAATPNLELSSETAMHACLNELACYTDVYNRTVSCNEGYSSVLCGACDLNAGYMRSGQLCRECDSFAMNVAWVVCLILTGVGYILYVVAFQDFSSTTGDERPVVIKIAMSFCQMLTVLGVFKARGTALFNELVQRPASIVGGGISAALPLKCLLNSQIYGSFILNMGTPLLAIIATSFLIGPVWACKRAHEAIRASRPPRRAPLEKVMICCCCKRAKLESWEKGVWMKQERKKEHGIFQPIPRFIAVLVFVLFGIYPTLVKSIFSIFRCSEVISGKQYLEDDYSVQCWVGWHPTFALAAVLCGVVYLFGIPLGIVMILRKNRHRLTEPRFISTFGFVYRGYHTDRGLVVAWEAFVMLRKLAVVSWCSFFSSSVVTRA